jgi:DinB superfamily
MSIHPRVEQLRFSRRELVRALDGVTEDDAQRRLMPMNSISWIVGHLAGQEYRYWIVRAQNQDPLPLANDLAPYGKPATIPTLALAWKTWHSVMELVDPYLDSLTSDALTTSYLIDGHPHDETVGTMIQRVIYHYWFHIGESQAIRQLLGHTNLSEFVGNFGDEDIYRKEPPSSSI